MNPFSVIFLCAAWAGIAQAKDAPRAGLFFDSPGVLNLAERTQTIKNGREVPATLMGAADSNEILTAPTLDEAIPALGFSDDEYGCKPPSRACSLMHERALMDATGTAVKRDGRRLTIAPASGSPAVFVDWTMATTKSADGDHTTHAYLGRLHGNGYHRVEVQFGHDAPGDFLINPDNGATAFVHNGSDIVTPAPDGMHLLTFNALNPPASLRVATLDTAGPRLALTCTVQADSPAIVQFKGWHDAASFDLALLPGGAIGEEIIALRVRHDAQGWHVASRDPDRIAAVAFVCRQPSS
ncbi:MAG: hypothetical protein ABIW82_18355 [Dokdonella sp.]